MIQSLVNNYKDWWRKPTNRKDRIYAAGVGFMAGLTVDLLIHRDAWLLSVMVLPASIALLYMVVVWVAWMALRKPEINA